MDRVLVWQNLTKTVRICQTLGIIPFFVLGDCPTGVDRHALVWIQSQKEFDDTINYKVFEADWKRFGGRAGPLRNIAMLNSGIDILLSFPGGPGTAHMTGICQTEGVMVKRISG